ncbi:MAG: hypothetical protein WC794_05360 [Candidatus Doudnabacteria bacterium]
MNCCGSHDHNTQSSGHSPDTSQTKMPTISLSRWILGFIVAILLIYLFTKVL